MKIALCDLTKSYALHKNEIDTAIQSILNEARFIMGKEVNEFEEHLQKYLGINHAIGCASGTDALLLALRSLDIQRDDEVITTPFTFISTVSAITKINAKPVFVDIDPQTFNLDPQKIEALITPKTKAIVVVHLFGQTADMDAINTIAKKHNLKVVEDNAQSLGAKYKDTMAGKFSDVATLSFFPAKTLGSFGDAGGVVTNNPEIAEKVKILRLHGCSSQYLYQEIGYNSRIDTIQAAILNIKLKYLNDEIALRREKAAKYAEILGQIEDVTFPYVAPNNYHVYANYVIKTGQRDKIKQALQKNEIAHSIYYPFPLHLAPCFQYLNYKKGDFPVAEAMSEQVLALPIHPYLTNDELEFVGQVINQAVSG